MVRLMRLKGQEKDALLATVATR